MGWTMTLRLEADSLRTMKIPLVVLKIIEEDKRLRGHKQNLDLIFSELLSNALDWGVLRLDSSLKKDEEGFDKYFALRQEGLNALSEGWIMIDLEYAPLDVGGKLTLRVEDSGPGFDYRNLDAFYDNAVYGGRGIHRVRALCEEFAYYGNGSRVNAVYGWEADV